MYYRCVRLGGGVTEKEKDNAMRGKKVLFLPKIINNRLQETVFDIVTL